MPAFSGRIDIVHRTKLKLMVTSFGSFYLNEGLAVGNSVAYPVRAWNYTLQAVVSCLWQPCKERAWVP